MRKSKAISNVIGMGGFRNGSKTTYHEVKTRPVRVIETIEELAGGVAGQIVFTASPDIARAAFSGGAAVKESPPILADASLQNRPVPKVRNVREAIDAILAQFKSADPIALREMVDGAIAEVDGAL